MGKKPTQWPSWPCQSSSPPRQEDAEHALTARGHAPGHLLPPCLLRDSLQRRHATPRVPSLSAVLIPFPLSLSRAPPNERTLPLAVAAFPAVPSLLRRAQELRLLAL